MHEPDTSTARKPQRFTWVRTAAGKVPTKWFAAIGTALFLGATAAFGGLAAAPEPPITELDAGDEHVSAELSITVERAVLLDRFPEAGISVEDGERVLAFVVHAENLWDRSIWAQEDGALGQSLRLEDGTAPGSIARFDDATLRPWIHPGLPAELVVTFAVDDDAYADGDEARVLLRDRSMTTGELIVAGEWWDDPVHTATVTVPVEDRGDGSGS